MSSATSTDSSTARPWHFFVLGALMAATAGVFLVGETTPAALILISAAIGSAALAGLALYRTLSPLASGEGFGESPTLGGRTRAALEREKMLVLRSIKELEFDRAMGKVSEPDFIEMDGRLRSRAIGLMRLLEESAPDYRQLIADEIESRLARRRGAGGAGGEPVPSASGSPGARTGGGGAVRVAASKCRECDTLNDADARFCKACGDQLVGAEAPTA